MRFKFPGEDDFDSAGVDVIFWFAKAFLFGMIVLFLALIAYIV